MPIESEDRLKIKAVLKAKEGQGWGKDTKYNARNAVKEAGIIYFENCITSFKLEYNNVQILRDNQIFLNISFLKKHLCLFEEKSKLEVNRFLSQKSKTYEWIRIEDMIKYLRENTIEFAKINQSSYRDFIEQRFHLIEEEIFEAYLTLFRTTYYSLDKNDTLEQELKSFNHDDQVYLLRKSLKNHNFTRIFLNINACCVSRNWLFIRLEKALQELRDLKVEQFDLGKMGYINISLREKINNKYPNLLRQLQDKHIVLSLNIDNYTLDRFQREIINDFWLPILRKINNCQTKGYLVLFIYRQTDWSENYDSLKEYLVKIEPANPYQYQDLNNVLINLSTKFNQTLNNSLLEAQRLLKQHQNNPQQILVEIYKMFQCDAPNFQQLWLKRYP